MPDQKFHEAFEIARRQLDDWNQKRAENFYTSDANLRSALSRWLDDEQLKDSGNRLEAVGADVAGELNRWAIQTNRDENLPTLRRFDGTGNRTEEVVFHPDYHSMGRRIYGSEIMKIYEKPGMDILQMAMFYLYSQNGEAGHNCPLACTAGAIKLISQVGSKQLKDRFLPRLLDPNYDTHFHASQFLTEVQGGSDVGANQTRAEKQSDGSWKLYGEKWFCSVADAGLMVLTARAEGAESGTGGLTCFVMPRLLDDGRPNGFSIRRLKYKIGTRSMASAEIDLDGAVAYAVGEQDHGFKYVVEIVLNTSRLYNAFAAAGMVRRAYVEAAAFASHRRAFGNAIGDFPLIKKSLARLRTESAAQLSSSLHVAFLAGEIAKGQADEKRKKTFRFLVNANKFHTSIRCTQAIREAIEVLGGNGTIEEFSVLPRLYRDAIVIESWEGTHNVLCQQLLRDMSRYRIHVPVFEETLTFLEEQQSGAYAGLANLLVQEWKDCRLQGDRLLTMRPERSALYVRSWVERTMDILQGVDLLAETNREKSKAWDTGKEDLLSYHLHSRILKEDAFDNEVLAKLEERIGRIDY